MNAFDPIDTLIPRSYQARQRREQAAQRRELALASAADAGRLDALGEWAKAAQAWSDVEVFVGSPAPRVFRRARRAAGRLEVKLPDPGRCQCGEAGSWAAPHAVLGSTGELGPAAWAGCPTHHGRATSAPVRRRAWLGVRS